MRKRNGRGQACERAAMPSHGRSCNRRGQQCRPVALWSRISWMNIQLVKGITNGIEWKYTQQALIWKVHHGRKATRTTG